MSKMISADEALLLVVDIQEKFRPHLFNTDEVVQGTQQMIAGCNQLGVPVLVTEQYPRGLGQTVEELQQAMAEATPVVEKTAFGCCGEPSVIDKLKQFNRKKIMVCGIEAPVCINQTVIQLLEAGYEVYLIEDAIGGRSEPNYHVTMRKLEQLGAIPSTVVMALFEMLRDAKHPQFKEVQALVK